MYGYNPYLLEETLRQSTRLQPHRDARLLELARRQYNRAVLLGTLSRIWSALLGRPRRLVELSAIAACVTGRYHAGTQTIAINRIAGSEGRAHDFDLAFRPLHNHSRERWLGVAMAHQQGAALPPVGLVQVGDVYFVRDGHHRISVARALGQRYIEAVVTVWQVAGPLPWEQPLASARQERAAA